jgi:hypothetical protein
MVKDREPDVQTTDGYRVIVHIQSYCGKEATITTVYRTHGINSVRASSTRVGDDFAYKEETTYLDLVCPECQSILNAPREVHES